MSATDAEWIAALLRRIREQFGIDTALLLSRCDDTLRVEVASGSLPTRSFGVGEQFAWTGSLCERVTREGFGSVNDVASDPRTRGLTAAHELGVNSYAGIPVGPADGTQYGVLCCLSTSAPGKSLNESACMMRLVSDLISERLRHGLDQLARLDDATARVNEILVNSGMTMALQGVFKLNDFSIDGWEALARFPLGWPAPNFCFEQAHEVGLGVDLELLAIRSAIIARAETDRPDLSLGVNVSPTTLLSVRLLNLIDELQPRHLVVELTEHDKIKDYVHVRAAREALRERGVMVAADDTGAGYAGLRHLVELQPDLLKLDRSIVADIDTDRARRSIARAMVNFARDMDMVTIAEGIETVDELRCCAEDLGVDLGQGFLLHRPVPAGPAVRSQAADHAMQFARPRLHVV